MGRTAIIFALFWELRPLARKMGIPFFKTLSRRIIAKDGAIALIKCGMGRENAKKAAKRIIRDFHPEVIVSAGFCGALAEDLKIGDIVTSDLSDGKIFCSPRPLLTYSEKLSAYRDHGAVVVDMESEGVRIVSGKYNIPCIAIKAVSDGLKDDIPKSFFTFTSLSKLIRFKRSMDIASKRLSEFLLNYIKEG